MSTPRRQPALSGVDTYGEFLSSKRFADPATGISDVKGINPALYDFQADVVSWALRRGRAAVFADCGLGKTPIQLEWCKHIPGRKLIVAPLAVSQQTIREGKKFDVPCKYLREDDSETEIVITNYEMIERFSPRAFDGVVLDESSILKSYTGKFRTYLIENWSQVPFRLAATATPAPNDIMELGNHAEFIGAMSRSEMLSHFFVHDGGETQKWRLKGHAESEFFKWLTSWSVMLRKPSDIGYDDGEFILPKLSVENVVVESTQQMDGYLFALQASSLTERRDARRASLAARVDAVAELVNASNEPWVVWCDLNSESQALASQIKGAYEVKGSDSIDHKEKGLLGFADGDHRVLVTKPSIAGFGMNWQHCSHMAFTGLSDSYEQFYQAVRRCWRFGQKRPVTAYVVTSDTEGAVIQNIRRKESDASKLYEFMVEHMADITASELHGITRLSRDYLADKPIQLPKFL